MPALFSTSQKAATINAAGMAGISDVALIQGMIEIQVIECPSVNLAFEGKYSQLKHAN